MVRLLGQEVLYIICRRFWFAACSLQILNMASWRGRNLITHPSCVRSVSKACMDRCATRSSYFISQLHFSERLDRDVAVPYRNWQRSLCCYFCLQTYLRICEAHVPDMMISKVMDTHRPIYIYTCTIFMVNCTGLLLFSLIATSTLPPPRSSWWCPMGDILKKIDDRLWGIVGKEPANSKFENVWRNYHILRISNFVFGPVSSASSPYII
jgi:hypothetical protein